MSETEKGVVERTPEGQFVAGTSGNPLGRPKGSKNKITLLKLAMEQAVREGSAERMIAVCEQIIEQAEEGHEKSQKLVWDAVMSKSSTDDKTQASEKVEIHIGGLQPKTVNVAEYTVIDNEDDADEADE